MGGQAQPPPRPPQHRGQGPGHRHRRAGLHRRAGPRQTQPGDPVHRPPPAVPVLPAAAAGSGATACVQRPGARRSRVAPPHVGDTDARPARRRLPDRGAAGPVPGQGGRVHPRPAGTVRPVSGVLVRPQPQGHADAGRRRPERLPTPAGPHRTQRARQLAGRLRPRRAELPDRAPPVPQHAPTQPAPLPGAGQGILPRAQPVVLPDHPVALLRPSRTTRHVTARVRDKKHTRYRSTDEPDGRFGSIRAGPLLASGVLGGRVLPARPDRGAVARSA